MTNAEKFKQEIDKLVKPNEQAETVLAYNIKTNKLERCLARYGITSCADCLFFAANNKNKVASCMENCEDWLQSEYEEHTEKDTISDESNEIEYIYKAKVKKLLFVEDGSVDMSNLYSQLSGNPEIAIIVYRKNSRTPVLANLEKEK